jgi:hypothetical protein
MSEISFFQKFSQKENHITNNTLLMLRHFYRYSPIKFDNLIKEIIGDSNIEIGLSFQQQVRESSSIPDAFISQKPINIFIEAKANGRHYIEQIGRHIKSAEDKNFPEGSVIIICLSKHKIPDQDLLLICEQCEKKRFIFVAISYSELLDFMYANCLKNETGLYEIIEDFDSFLDNVDMLDNPFRMVVFPCRISLNENIKYGIYYEQATKPSKAHSPYLGIYKNKKITHFGRIKTVAICKTENNELVIKNGKEEKGKLTKEDKLKIIAMIRNTTYYDLGKEFERYYLVEKLFEINIEKNSPSGIRGHRYFDLADDFAKKSLKEYNMEDICLSIKQKSFI